MSALRASGPNGHARPRRRRAVVLGILAAALLVPAFDGLEAGAVGIDLQAPTPAIVVDTTTDAPDALATDGLCRTAAGQCSLRAAVAQANTTSGATITVPAGTYVLNNTSGSDRGDLDLRKPMTITGAGRQPGPGATTIDGNNADRIFEVLSAGVAVDGVVITKGNVGSGLGGGFFVPSSTGAVVIRNSTIVGNRASFGGGFKTYGNVQLQNSTLSGNTATGRGGGVAVEKTGVLVATNSTINGNAANGGGGVNSAGKVTLNAVTVSSNTSNNSNGGGIARTGGTFNINGSILAGNNGATGRDCSGSPAFGSANIVQNTPGCNPTGTPLTVADPQLGSLTDNGGPTLTRLQGAGSPAIDAYAGPCVTPADQRNVSRTPPPGGRCDIGALESAPLTVDVSLAATAPPTTTPCETGVVCVGTGVSSVPIDRIPTSALVASSDPELDEPDQIFARRTFARRTFARRTFARRTFARRTDLIASPVSELTLQDLFARRTFARRTSPIEQVLLSEIPLRLADGRTWDDLLSGTEFQGVPLQFVTLAQVIGLPQVESLSLAEADVLSTALKDLSGAALALAPLSLDKIPLDDDPNPLTGWCEFLAGQLPGGCADLDIDPDDLSTASDVGLVTLQLAGVDPEELALESIFARRTDLSGTYLESIFARRTDLAASEIGAVFARRTDAADAVIDCSRIACDGTATLAQAQAAGAIKDTATVADLLAYLETLPGAEEISLLDLLLSLTPVLFPGEGIAFEEIDLRATPLQGVSDPLQPPASFTATITVGGGSPADATVAVTLPPGFEPVPGSATFDGAPIADGSRDGQTLTFRRTSVAVGQHTLTVAARAGLDLGSVDASVQVDATAGSQARSDSASTSVLVVVESFEQGGGPTDVQPINPRTINVAHLSSAYDQDLYSFYVSPDEAASGTTARIDLSNLARDYDLVLYGPRSEPLRGTPKARLQPVDDTGLGFDTRNEQVAPDVQRDVPVEPPADCGLTGAPEPCFPYAVAAQRETEDELIETGTLIPGTYWVQVTGYNGEFGPEPYVVRVIKAQGDPVGTCAPRTPAPASAGPAVTYPPGVGPGSATGYIVLPEARLLQQYGAAAVQPVIDRVNAVAARTSSAIVRADADPAVKAAYDAWDAEPCSIDGANDVVRAIGDVLDQLDAVTPGAASVTLVGNHVITPMGLIPDATSIGNENTYDPGVVRGQDTSLTAAQQAGYVQTDTPYASSNGFAINAGELYVPDRAVGRLVENPNEIAATLQRFLDFNGVLDADTTTSAFVSGYDFIGDGAKQTADVLRGQPNTTVDELTTEDWTKDDLKAGLIDRNPDLGSISAHFDHNRALPALGNSTDDESDMFRTSDVAGAGNLANALVLSIGCHSGLSVPDIELALTDPIDWAQTFSGEGATYLGNTGYGYGDSDLVLYSERLQVLYAEQLRAGATTGAGLMAAKQAYFAELAAISPYDAKVLSEWTLYGLPMWKVGGAFGAPAPAAAPAAPAAFAAPAPPDSVEQSPVQLSIGPAGAPPAPGVLTRTDTGDGVYYQQNGDTISVQYRPVQPSVERDVTRPGRQAMGVLVTDAQSVDLGGFTPYYARPVIDQAGNEQFVAPVGDAVFPATLARVANPVKADGSTASTMTLAAGQFRQTPDQSGTGTQRLFTRLDTEVTYADVSETDLEPPSITRSDASVVNATVGFSVRTSPDTNRVYVLYRTVSSAANDWEGLDLVRTGTDPTDGSAIWTGGAVLPTEDADIEYLAQAVDQVGNVAYTNNKTSNFLAAPSQECEQPPTLEPAAALTPSGWYVAPGGVTVTFSQPGLLVSLDGGPLAPVPAGGLLVTGEGIHTVDTASGNTECSVVVPIDTRGPLAGAELDPAPNGAGFNEGPVDLVITATDPGGSGVKQLTYSVNGGTPVVVEGTSATVPVAEKGETVVTYSAVDAAGNGGPEGRTTVNIDGAAPTVTSVIEPAPVNGWNRGSATVRVTAADAETGIREIRTTTGDAPPVATPGDAASVTVTTEGETTVGYTAIDRAGNEASGSTVVRVDSSGPVINISAPPGALTLGSTANAGFSCADGASGLASCTAVLTGPGVNQPVADGQAVPTATPGTYTLTVNATDAVGNPSTASRAYSVRYGVCLGYNPATIQPLLATVILRVRLCDAAGTNLSSSALRLTATTVDGTITPRRNVWGLFNLGFNFFYDSSSRSYVYALPTPGIGAGPHSLGFAVNGTAAPSYVAPFTLR